MTRPQLIADVGFPPGVINLVHGSRDAVEALIDHPLLCGISLVGSTPVARAIYARAAANGKRVQAQGGAKNVLVVMPDAVLEPTVANVIGSCFGSAGQRCLAGSLIITVGDMHDRFLAALREAATKMRVGNGADPGVDMGPVISERARDRVVGYIERGVQSGATLVLDGRDTALSVGTGCFLGPTIFDNVTPDMAIARDEIFGPLVGIVQAKNLDEAITIIERSPYGNAASIFTQSGAAAREFRYRARRGTPPVPGDRPVDTVPGDRALRHRCRHGRSPGCHRARHCRLQHRALLSRRGEYPRPSLAAAQPGHPCRHRSRPLRRVVRRCRAAAPAGRPAIGHVLTVLRGETPPDVVNPAVLQSSRRGAGATAGTVTES